MYINKHAERNHHENNIIITNRKRIQTDPDYNYLERSRMKNEKKKQYFMLHYAELSNKNQSIQINRINQRIKRLKERKQRDITRIYLPKIKEFNTLDIIQKQKNHKINMNGKQIKQIQPLQRQSMNDLNLITSSRPKIRSIKQSKISEIKQNNNPQQHNKIIKKVNNIKTQGDRYYVYLQNYKSNEQLKKENNMKNKLKMEQQTEDQSFKSKTNSKQKDIQTLFYQRIIKNQNNPIPLTHSSIIGQKSNQFKFPSNQQQMNDFLIKYQAICEQFNLKQMINSNRFKIVQNQEYVYFGQVHNNLKHGLGILLTHKCLLQGIFINNYITKGGQRNKNGIYIGSYHLGKRQGFGTFKWKNQEYYEGEWKSGKKSGHGIWKSKQGDQYQGQWLNNKQNGKGYYLHVGDSKYSGYFKDFLKHGKGQQHFINGDKYYGQYQNGKPHGHGKYIWKNGNIYEGQFKQGSRSGQGTLKTNDYIYEGYFLKDKKQGKGKQRYNNGNIFQGMFFQNQKQAGRLLSPKGEVLQQFQNDLQQGQ